MAFYNLNSVSGFSRPHQETKAELLALKEMIEGGKVISIVDKVCSGQVIPDTLLRVFS